MRNRNGQMWFTKDGKRIQAHGGMILHHEGTFYWYGENKEGENALSKGGGRRVDFIGINCYSSKDLMDWQDEGMVLKATTNPESPLYKDNVVERPKVIFNEKTGKFVLWFHYDTDDYLTASCGVAIADKPTGPFVLQSIFTPNRKDSRDMTIFKDEEKAYLIHSSDFNKTLYIAELTDDYQNVSGVYTKIFVDQEREAPTMFKAGGNYYTVTSGCTGWEPNSALASWSPQLFAPHKLMDNPCEGPNYRKTFGGQPTYIFEHANTFYLMIDHWQPEELKNSGYSILPIERYGRKKRELRISWSDKPFGGKVTSLDDFNHEEEHKK